jgi:penicillin-binding protein 1A
MALALLGGVVFAALWLVTPSVANAPRLVRDLQQARDAPLAGRLPVRFTAAMQALEARGRKASGPQSTVTKFVGQIVLQSARRDPAVEQQLASLLYMRKRKGEIARIEQAVLVVKLHWSYSDSALIRMFATVASFGHGYYGVAAASCGYFGQRPGHLSWGQIAMLAAIAANPVTNDPYEHFAHARRDQAAVLRALAVARTFSRDQAAKIANEPLHLRSPSARSLHHELAHRRALACQ